MKNKLDDFKLSYYFILVSLIFLAMIGSIFVGSSVLFIFKIPITKINFLIFPLIAILFIKLAFKKNNKDINWSLLIVILISFYIVNIGISIGCNLIWDYSYDSLAYHQEGVIRLINGWNPFYESNNDSINLWVNHYAKAPWIFAATIAKITGHIESGKILSVLIPLILGVFSFGVFYIITKKKIVLSSILAILLVINPVNIGQSFTYYVDSLLGCYILFLLMILYLIIFTDGLTYFKYFSMFNIAIFMCNIKFTGLAYAGGILGMYFIYVLLTAKAKKKLRIFAFLLISLVITVGVIGFNPYITNTINKGNPLYPLSGEDKIDIMTPNTPENFRFDSEFRKAYESLLAYPTNENYKGNIITGKDMFKVDKNVYKFYAGVDPRVRGFGIYSTIFLPISLILVILLIIICKNRKIQTTSILALIGLISVTLYGGEFWWARYVAYIWLFPVLVSGLLAINKKIYVKLLGYLMIVLLFINSVMIIPYTAEYKLEQSTLIKAHIFEQKQPIKITKDNFQYSYENKAKEYNIDYILN
ncbi:hypothetical protein [Clostridium tarantellae]|uniref:Glycosyltransferase RgtA/B/C/D-like domain-containing protein n=1 Tax=Clostridium tarantellae TaxID=39493 RepID=A0A6I1MK78_9CLOT|nr:hypothetical protein [Clostridium tarantellae]MPQ42582.1 hypothetical protein [Clostridium tarantellae]